MTGLPTVTLCCYLWVTAVTLQGKQVKPQPVRSSPDMTKKRKKIDIFSCHPSTSTLNRAIW